MSRPLRVLELAQGIAGPVLGRLFAGLGEDVIKVEPPGGDYLRGGPGDAGAGYSYAFAVVNSGKRTEVLDIEEPEDRAALDELIRTADVVVSDLNRVTLTALGLTGEARAGRYPGLVVVALTAFGLDDTPPGVRPDSMLAEAYGGLAAMIGDPGRAPLTLGGEQAAHAAGFAGLLGAALALERVGQGGGGDLVDVALSDVAAYIDWKSDVNYSTNAALPRRTGSRAGRWRVVRARDGWVGVVYQPDQWEAVVRLVGADELGDPALADEAGREARAHEWWPVIERWAARREKHAILEQAQQLGLAFGIDTGMADLTASPQYRHREFLAEHPRADGGDIVNAFFRSADLPAWNSEPIVAGSGLTWRGDGGASPARRRQSPDVGDALPSPLTGMVVLDLGMITAGAAVGRLLADYGATVVKVESPRRPDPFREWAGPSASGVGSDRPADAPVFESNNAGKLGLALDLKRPEDLATFRSLARRADVLIENFRVGVTERLGIDEAALRAINPNLTYLSLSSQGRGGPESSLRSYGSTLDLLSGLASVTGYGDGTPIWSGAEVNYPDQLVSLFGAGIVVYCRYKRISAAIDTSQRELVSWTIADRIAEYRLNGIEAEASGNHRPYASPHDIFPSSEPDTWVAVACFTDDQRAALAALVGAASPLGLEDAVARWARARTRDAAVASLRSRGVPCAPVLNTAERAAEPHFRERAVFLQDPARRKGFPFRFERGNPIAPRRAPAVGEDNARIIDRLDPQRRHGTEAPDIEEIAG